MDSPTRVSSQPRVGPTSTQPQSSVPAPLQTLLQDSQRVETLSGGIVHFDATEPRRDRLRREATLAATPAAAAAAAGVVATSPALPATSIPNAPQASHPISSGPAAPAAAPASPAPANADSPTVAGVAAEPWWERVMRDYDDLPSATPATQSPQQSSNGDSTAVSVAPSVNGQHHCSEPASDALSTDELRAFLVNFVVEQTGYPEEIVEMDADLEADLGIDSIKKAQMFGEIGEHFGLQPDENISLDDFLNLESVLAYLVAARVGGNGETQPTAAPSIVDAILPTPSVQPSASHVDGVAKVDGVDGVMPSDAAAPSPDELRTFLVNFVVEQTGYPEEIVEMDADLEADLGIDSIKKAQMFGEIGEYFALQPDENTSLDEFATLEHVLAYLEANLQ